MHLVEVAAAAVLRLLSRTRLHSCSPCAWMKLCDARPQVSVMVWALLLSRNAASACT